MEEEGKHLMMVGSEEARKRLAFAILAVSDLEKVILHKIGSESNSKDEEAIKAAKQWLFEPGTRFGEPVAILVDLQLDFNLR